LRFERKLGMGLEIMFMDCEETIKRENRDAVRGGC
jgi:hypothetical protein